MKGRKYGPASQPTCLHFSLSGLEKLQRSMSSQHQMSLDSLATVRGMQHYNCVQQCLNPNTSHSCEQSTHFIFWTNCSAYKYALVFSCSALFIVLMPGDVRCNSCGTRTRVKLQIALFALLLLLHSAVQCLLCCCTVSPLQISWRDATCPPPPGAGGKFNDSNGSLKESGLISHSTGTGHHPQSRHQTLISFYSIPTAKTQCSRREDKKGSLSKMGVS